MKVVKSLSLGFAIILLSCSESAKNEELILSKWYMYKIEDLKIGREEGSGSLYGCPYVEFSSNNSFKSFDGMATRAGKWEFMDDNILLITEEDTSQLHIQKISKSEVEWIVDEGTSQIKFFLSTSSPEDCQ